MVIISACLVGINCRYDGKNELRFELLEWIKQEGFIPVCPEQLGGLPTPRIPASIKDGDGFDVLAKKAKVVNLKGIEVTDQFLKGAFESLKLAKLMNIKRAILKEESPSCGINLTYCNDNLIEGRGVCAALFINEGIEVVAQR
jgi:uncharacterized protein YbbK (DUF523 family)